MNKILQLNSCLENVRKETDARVSMLMRMESLGSLVHFSIVYSCVSSYGHFPVINRESTLRFKFIALQQDAIVHSLLGRDGIQRPTSSGYLTTSQLPSRRI
jgi:hypothetical protein